MDTVNTEFENWGVYLMKQFQAMYQKGERCDLEISCNKQIFLVRYWFGISQIYVRNSEYMTSNYSNLLLISGSSLNNVCLFGLYQGSQR